MSSADRRRELIAAALRVIAANGVAAATTRAIVAEADMSLASFHYAFESRDAMMRDLIEVVVHDEVAAVFAEIEFTADLRETLRSGLQGYFDNLVAEPAREQVMFELMHFALRTPGLEHLAREQYERYFAAVVSVLEQAQHHGVAWSLPLDDIARFIVTVTDGVTLAWLANRDTDAANRVLDFAADSLARLALPPEPSPATPDTATPHLAASPKEPAL